MSLHRSVYEILLYRSKYTLDEQIISFYWEIIETRAEQNFKNVANYLANYTFPSKIIILRVPPTTALTTFPSKIIILRVYDKRMCKENQFQNAFPIAFSIKT